jgi:hypothetical protein
VFLLVLSFFLSPSMHHALGQGNTEKRSLAANLSQVAPPSTGAITWTYAALANPAPNIVAPAAPSQATSTWTAGNLYPATIARYGFAQTSTHFSVFGGVSNGTRVSDVNRMDIATGLWESRAPMIFASEAPTCALMASTGIVYCTEGDTGSGFASYNIATDTWTPLASIPGGNHSGSASGAFNGKVFVAGGTAATTNAVQVYDVASNTWSAGTAAPNAFLLAGYQQVGQFLYVVGGFDATFVNNPTTLRLDMSSAPGVWDVGPVFTPQRADFGLAYDPSKNKLYALGGDLPYPFNSTNLVDALDVSGWPSGTWTSSTPNLPLPARQAAQAGFFGNGDIWAVGGINGATFQYLNEVWHRTNGDGAVPITVTSSADAGGICPGASCTLRQAIATAASGDTITFAANVRGTISLTSGELLINKNLTINGPGANLLSVQRSTAAGNFRIFNITPNSVVVAISGLTIANGNSPSNGGGISNTGALTIANSTISGNSTGSSAGGIVSSGTLIVVNSTVSGNSATGGFGGGIYNTGTAQIINSTISGNSVSESSLGIGSGGGIQNGGGSVSMTNSTISGNSAQFRGGGINSSGTLASRNTIIALNTAPSGPDVFGTLTSENFNLIGNNSGVTITPAQLSDQIGTAGSPINPMLGPLQNNGGPTLTRALLSGSPALDKGHSSGLTTDQRGAGFPRTADYSSVPNAAGGDGTDIGAVEFWTLKITSITHLANGHAVLQGIGIPSHLHTIEASPDLSPNSFGGIGTANANATGALQYDDAGAVGLTKRFYRLAFP